MNWGLVAPFVSKIPANVKRHERSESEVVQDEFCNQFWEVKCPKIIRKHTLPQKSFAFNAVKFMADEELP